VKLCPQCAFIYEDDQRVCDMDGRNLVHTAPTVLEPQHTPPTRLTISLAATSESSPAKSSSRRSRGLVILVVVLATLLFVVVSIQIHRSRSLQAVQSPRPAPSAALDNKPQPSPADLVSSTAIAATTLSQHAEQAGQSPESPQESRPTNIAVMPSNTKARLASGPVTAGASTEHSRSVVLRLKNGATINADEVWKRKEGVWYRQAGMVTFLKGSRVSSIERSATPRSQPQTAVNNVGERTRKSDDHTAQSQLRLRRPERVETKKPSRVNAFIKWTGRILKKPFKS
jgi:hypothetical protein